ncbi:MAG: class I SAM-dependent methyltransferase, partial [Sandaracinaceae bacterium]|nr:class I SAM-dependent methyltransferase [Sandaracinaceae bacterium]
MRAPVTTRFNPLDHRIALSHPERLTPHSGWTEHIPFGMLLVELLRPRVIVELGTQHGDSYCAFCQAVAELHLDARCHAVDTWTGDEHSGTYGPEVLADLRAHHDPRYAGFSELLQCTFDEASERFEPGSIDLLHIDGYHTCDVVGHDLETWLPKMSARGVVLLHDTNVRRADFGVWRVFSEAKEHFEHFELLHGHGLGLLVVGGEPPEPVRLLTRASDGDRQAIREHFHRLGERLTALARVGSLTEEAAAREHRIVALTHQASELSKLAADQRAAIEAKDVFIAELQHRAGEAEGLRRMIDEVDRDRA